jgi:hypothetical protein
VSELQLTRDGELAFARAQELCAAMNLGIVTPEQVLTGAIIVLAEERGMTGLPATDVITRALVSTQGVGEMPPDDPPMFGSAARQAIATCAATVRQVGGSEIGALEIALGTIASGEVNPMFYGALGLTKQDLIAALGS